MDRVRNGTEAAITVPMIASETRTSTNEKPPSPAARRDDAGGTGELARSSVGMPVLSVGDGRS
ncbi:hypothetical protein Aau02nite_66570 [Amorphoplanes auranticolor]|uniref:Uncharacterized protein n=1 Tax=Actinoplanes auranticolor TaxID=47988 RepID=A0A919VT47_9ACTN|nr:hypothetical protein Aau02nite_66570 [Actinoplanes auranticolor]